MTKCIRGRVEAGNPLLARFLGRPRGLRELLLRELLLMELLLREGVAPGVVCIFTCTGSSPCCSNLRRCFQCMGFLDLEEAGVLTVDFFGVLVLVIVVVAGRGVAVYNGIFMGGGMVVAMTGVVWIAVVTDVCC